MSRETFRFISGALTALLLLTVLAATVPGSRSILAVLIGIWAVILIGSISAGVSWALTRVIYGRKPTPRPHNRKKI